MNQNSEFIDLQPKITNIEHRSLSVASKFLKRKVTIELIEFNTFSNAEVALLLLNDGQDLDKMRVKASLEELAKNHNFQPFVTVAIHAGDRINEYGVSGQPDYLKRGNKAHHYELFIKSELIPFIKKAIGKNIIAEHSYFSGCSLGGLSAFDIAISNQNLFRGAGVFSGSFWWRSSNYDSGYTQNDRIIFNKMEGVSIGSDFRTWLMAGSEDESNDRSRSGVTDSVDDTLDVHDYLCRRTGGNLNNIALRVVPMGKHHPSTWSEYFSEFLKFAFLHT